MWKTIKQKINMNLKNEFQPIRDWAEVKGIYQSGDIKTQTLKLLEEAGELAKAIIKNDSEEFIDAIGDCVVVLTSIAELGKIHFSKNNQIVEDYDLTIETCINSAYEVIAKRKGEMINGSFVKHN